jgi:hypothetical protein
MTRAAPLLASFLLLGACTAEPPSRPAAAPLASRAEAAAASTSVVMSGLDSPRGLAWGPEGALYVAEAGSTVVTGACAPVARGANCYSGTGAISRLWRGRQERVVSGLPSLYNAAVADIIGPDHLSFVGRGNLALTIGWGGDPAAREQLGALAAQFGALYSVSPGGQWRIVADVAAFEGSANPAGGPIDSNPFGVLAEPGTHYVTDAGGNSLLQVAMNGDVSLVATFPSTPVPAGPFNPPFPRSEAVPTSVTRGPDGALYVGTLSGAPFLPGAARIYRVVPGEAPQVYAEGLTQVTDHSWAADGSLYVLQYASLPFFGGAGSVIRVAPDGTRSTVAAGLFHATGVLAAPDGAIYVSNNGNLAGIGEVLRIVP